MDRRKLVDKRSGFFSTKRTSALDGLLSKLDKQMAQEPMIQSPQIKSPTVAVGGATFPKESTTNQFKIGAKPFNPTMSRRGRKPKRASDPLNMKQKAREARRNAILSRHKGGTYSTNTNEDPVDEVEGDLKDLESNEEFVDENKDKTMEWTEPDGSKTTLKFDQDGTLIGKETTKSSRPDKFSKDLKKAVDRNGLALKDYEESLMTDPVQ